MKATVLVISTANIELLYMYRAFYGSFEHPKSPVKHSCSLRGESRLFPPRNLVFYARQLHNDKLTYMYTYTIFLSIPIRIRTRKRLLKTNTLKITIVL